MYKMGGVAYEWVLFQVKDMGKVFGLVLVPKDLLVDDEKVQANYKRLFMASVTVSSADDQMVEISAAYQLLVNPNESNMMKPVPMNMGDRRICLRKDFIIMAQIMDTKSPVVAAVIREMSVIEKPGAAKDGEITTGSGIILPGAAQNA